MKNVLKAMKSKKAIALLVSSAVVGVLATLIVTTAKTTDSMIEDLTTDLDA